MRKSGSTPVYVLTCLFKSFRVFLATLLTVGGTRLLHPVTRLIHVSLLTPLLRPLSIAMRVRATPHRCRDGCSDPTSLQERYCQVARLPTVCCVNVTRLLKRHEFCGRDDDADRPTVLRRHESTSSKLAPLSNPGALATREPDRLLRNAGELVHGDPLDRTTT